MADAYDHDLFDVDYFQRKRWIAEADIPNTAKAAGSTMKAVLHVIHDHYGKNGNSWPSQQRIAELLSVHPGTIERAIRGLKELSLLIALPTSTGRGKGVHNTYVIVWAEVTLREPSRRDAHRRLLESQARPTNGQKLPIAAALHSSTEQLHSSIVPIHSSTVQLHSSTMLDELSNNSSKNKPSTIHPERSTSVHVTSEPDPWVGVVGVLKSLGMSEPGTRKGVTAAQRRELTPSQVIALVERWQRLKARRPHDVNVAWLYWWLTGKHDPPTENDSVGEDAKPRSSSLTSDTTRQELVRTRIVKAGRRAGLSEDAIEQKVRAALVAKSIQPPPPTKTDEGAIQAIRNDLLTRLSQTT